MIAIVAVLAFQPCAAVAADGWVPGRVTRSPAPAHDDPLRDAKIADQRRVTQLNSQQARATAARDRARVNARDSANRVAQARYRAAMDTWRRRVAACRAGDWSQCER